ncbi:hypothetical protein LTR37_001460 [Vermiconidia calcicola]|uniref:Uncharacterized protein n=1 Tax=Vermiconidia calcicola TaxID=1690605 RepID=A0ACC3NXE5_9PEZI|nr:hypothetical protein LTR37_001460 [Vermiconidia calcicola]
MSAAQNVFDLPELLEHILCFLPVRDLLLVSTVSRSFKNVIDATTPIQRQLHLLGEKGDEVRTFHLIFFAGIDESCDENSIAQKFRFPIDKLFFDCSLRTNCEESWERMHITQPPSTTAIICLEFKWAHEILWYYDQGREEISVARPDGVRIADIIDIFAEFWEMDCSVDYQQSLVTVPEVVEVVDEAKTQDVCCSKSPETWVILGEEGYGRHGRLWTDALREERDWDRARALYIAARAGEEAKYHEKT